MKSAWLPRILWLVLGIFLVFFALNRHARSDRFNYHSEIWADKAGYQIYLSAFEYGWDARNLPDTSMASKTGYGFFTDFESGAFITKYTYGTALAQLPFYLIGRAFESGDEMYPGFSVTQNRMISVAAAVYLLIGLLFLYGFLRSYHSPTTVFWVLITLLFGTNLLYYGSHETGMSHVYSFAVFAGLLLFVKRRSFFANERFWEFLIYGLLSGWIVMLRQSNALFPILIIFLNASTWTEMKSRFGRMLKLKNLLWILLGGLIMLIPQVLYWNYAFESMVAYSYGEEGFNWFHPRIIKSFFDPYNGLFIYMPIFALLIFWMIQMGRRQVQNGRLVLLSFVLLSYVFSCWWAWWFGCAFGQRSYVEYFTLLSIPLAYGIAQLKLMSSTKRIAIIAIMVICCAYTSKMAMSIDYCFEGSKNWDWQAYELLLKSPMK